MPDVDKEYDILVFLGPRMKGFR